jgi:glycosyltransferase involved in cell wall biosynthesis
MKSTIGIFRALDVRVPHIDFAASFSTLKSVFIANLSAELKQYIARKKIASEDMQLKPVFKRDPVFPLLKKTDFTPWLAFDTTQLEEAVSGVGFYEVYEPYFFYSSQIANVAHKKSIPLITEIWTSFPTHPTLYVPPYSFLVKNVIQKTDLFVFRSRRAMSYLNSFTIPEEKKVVIYQGIDQERFFPAKRKDDDRIRILFVGVLAPHKGLDDLLAVFPQLVATYPNKLELVICGVGPMREQVEKAAKKFPIDYRGYVTHSDLPEIYRKADIYCQPSKDYFLFGIKGGEEFAGYTFMEAMATGLPVVSTYCGGIPEIVGSNNILITQGDRHALFSGLDRLIASKALRKEIGSQNKLTAGMFYDVSLQTKRLEKVIHEKLN